MINYSNNTPLSFNEISQHEKEIYEKQLIKLNETPKEINLDDIFSRKKDYFEDRIFNMPQNLFFLENEKYPTIVWRKILSQLYIDWKINALNCSQISDSMLLGFLVQKKVWEILSVEYKPFINWEKVSIFTDLIKDKLTNIYYPYQYLDFETG